MQGYPSEFLNYPKWFASLLSIENGDNGLDSTNYDKLEDLMFMGIVKAP